MRVLPKSARGLSLRQLLSAAIVGADDIWFGACCADSRACHSGDLFVAVTGVNSDGHDFVGEALNRGAGAVLAERVLPMQGRPYCIVPDSREAYGQICQALAGNPSRRVKTIGITGTNGKTTTSYLIASILRTAGHQAAVMGTLGAWDGESYTGPGLTTPTAPVLADWLARSEAAGCSHAVMEVSSHGLSQRRVAGIEFDAACLTNVRRDHLDYHTTLQNYRRAKASLFQRLTPDGFAVLNADDEVSAGMLDAIDRPALTVGIRESAEITATILERHASEQTFLLTAGSETVAVQTRMIGDHHVSNCLLAAAVGLVYGIDLSDVARGLERVDRVPGRLERLDCGQSFSVFVDYAHTPDALETVLSGLRQVHKGRLICVFGAGGDRDREKRPLMGRAVEERADLAVITNDNPRGEDPAAIFADIRGGFSSKSRVHVIADRAEAIAWALQQAREGDCVLIAGKGHEDHQIVGRRQYLHDDRVIAQEWLYNHGQAGEGRSSLRLSA